VPEPERLVVRERPAVGTDLLLVEEDGLGPLQVVEHDDLRPLRSTCLEKTPECEARLVWRRAHDRIWIDPERDEDLDERPVRDALAVVEAAAAKDVGLAGCALEKVADQPRLADAYRPEKREQPACPLSDDVLELSAQTLSLSLAADKRCFRVSRDRSCALEHLDQPISLDRLGLPFELERRNELRANGVAHEAKRVAAEERLPRRRGLLEACSDIDRVAGDEGLVRRCGDDFAGVHADAGLQAVLRDRASHLLGGADRAQRVVFVRNGDAEDRHHRVADELLDCAPVTLDDPAQVVEVTAHLRAERFGIRRLSQRRRADDIREENGHDLPDLARSRSAECRAARVAEPRVVRILAPAARANGHARSLGAGRLQLGELDVVRERRGKVRIEATGADLEHSSGPSCDRLAHGIVG
jgi:hypothetical protein